jgi:hypothetical protein
MMIRALRRHTKLYSRMVLFAMMLQAAAATAPAACVEMSPAPENTVHAAHLALTSEAEFGSDTSCDCSPGEPAESDERELGSCVMAAHCVSSPAVRAGAIVLASPAIEIQAVPHLCVQPQVVVLSHPTPPPRV